jgi:hypothetical protein
MAKEKVVRTTLQEDFERVGLKADIEHLGEMGGAPPLEAPPAEENLGTAKKCEKCGKEYKGEKCLCSKKVEGVDDPFDGPLVTKELLERIGNLPFENFEESDFDDLLNALKEKELPEGDEELATLAEAIVQKILDEKIGIRQRRHKARSMAKGKPRFFCQPGYRKAPGDETGKRCVPAHQAVAGGMGGLKREGRVKKRRSRSGKGKRSERISKRWAARREGVVSPFAAELAALHEGDSHDEPKDVRDEILGRVEHILEMLSEEFLDNDVAAIFAEAYEPLMDAWEGGRLDEDVMEHEDFIAEVRPVLALITKSLDKIDREEKGESGN